MSRKLVSTHYGNHSSRILLYAPSLITITLTLFSMTELPLPWLNVPTPCLGMMAMFYVSLWQPRYMPPVVAFSCGLIYDTFQSSLFGTYALMFLALRLAVTAIRRRKGYVEKCLPQWGLFTVCAMIWLVIEWGVLSLQLGHNVLSTALLQRNVLTLLLYPLLYLLLSSIIATLQSRAHSLNTIQRS